MQNAGGCSASPALNVGQSRDASSTDQDGDAELEYRVSHIVEQRMVEYNPATKFRHDEHEISDSD